MMTDRRDFLGALAAAPLLLAGCATGVSPGRRYAKVIDAHAHWYPR